MFGCKYLKGLTDVVKKKVSCLEILTKFVRHFVLRGRLRFFIKIKYSSIIGSAPVAIY